MVRLHNNLSYKHHLIAPCCVVIGRRCLRKILKIQSDGKMNSEEVVSKVKTLSETEKKDFLENILSQLNLTLTEKMKEQFLLFYKMLVEKNKVMNLTAITDYPDVVVRHFMDSLTVLEIVDFKETDQVIDLGTGAGFPGIPLKIMLPDTSFVLADSLNKRIRFLEDVIRECGFDRISAIHGRAEDLAGKGSSMRGSFDYCLSRAVARLSSLSEYCLPFLKTGGYFISYKAGNIEDELEEAMNAVRILGGKTEECRTFTLPGTDITRTLIVIRKVSPTPGIYPRKAGTPVKKPL